MNPAIEITRLAHAQLDRTRAWYELQRSGLGQEFLDEVEHYVSAIQESPLRFPIYHNAVRRCLLKRFPYQMLFDIRPSKIRLLRVVHSSQDPGPIRDLLP